MGCNLVMQGILPIQCNPLRGSFSYYEVFFFINPVMNAHRFHLLYNRCAIHNILPHAIFTICLYPSTMQQMNFSYSSHLNSIISIIFGSKFLIYTVLLAASACTVR